MCIPSVAAGVEGGGGWRADKQSLTCWVPMLHIPKGTYQQQHANGRG